MQTLWTEKAFSRVEQDVQAGIARGAILNRLRVFHRLETYSWDSVRSAFRRASRMLPKLVVRKKMKLVVTGSDTSVQVPEELVRKCVKRAQKHFRGGKVKHRVVSSSDTHLTLRFNRYGTKYSCPKGYEVTVRKA